MPPTSQDPFAAAHEALQGRPLELAWTALAVACEPWILAVIALACLAWLERDVPSVMRSFLPLGAALLVATFAAVLGGAALGGEALATAVVGAYGVAAYGAKGLPLLLLPLAGGLVRAHATARWGPDVLRGFGLGAAIGITARLVAAKVSSRRRVEP